MSSHFRTIVIAMASVLLPQSAWARDEGRDALWAAVRDGNVKAIEAALDKGADVNAKNEIGITALWIAASKGKLEVVDLLVKRGADVNARDGIWYQTPLSQSLGNLDIVKLLVKAGAKDVDAALLNAVSTSRTAVVQALIDSGKLSQEALDAAITGIPEDKKELIEILKNAGAKPFPPISEENRKAWTPLAGEYETENGTKFKIELGDRGLVLKRASLSQILLPVGPDAFRIAGLTGTYTFHRKGGDVPTVTVRNFTNEATHYRAGTKPVAVAPKVAPKDTGPVKVADVKNWPSFRGQDASGVADGQHPPLTWDVKKNTNVQWKTAIPGLGHSCPIVWGDRVFLTTAVSGNPDPKIRIGNYGDVGSVNDTTEHTWHVICLDRHNGEILWNRQAFKGVPKIKRHLKGSQANCTPATDGKVVVACFGSEGMYCYDFTGKLVWQRDLGTLDASFTIDRQYEWGFGSSPIIHDGLVILQCDVGKESFIAAFRLEDGSKAWSTPRDEIPSWSSPTIWRNSKRVELVTNAAQYARSYDPASGAELWRLAKKSEVTIPTPIAGRDLIYITSGNRPIQPIFAIKPGAKGDISLKSSEDRNDHILWSRMRGGPYMPTPILYGDHLYTCANGGMVTCYEAMTGKEIYKERLGGDSYTASPVAADGKIYFASESGQVRVVQAGPEFHLLAMNEIGDYIMATPAISGGTLFVRSQHYLWALGARAAEEKR
jgi:outer membrane protein assembly factor BamB